MEPKFGAKFTFGFVTFTYRRHAEAALQVLGRVQFRVYT